MRAYIAGVPMHSEHYHGLHRHELSRRDLLRGAAAIGGAVAATSLLGEFAGIGTATSAEAAARIVTPRGTNDIGSIGDSISHNGVGKGVSGVTDDGMAVFGVQSFIGWALLQSQGRFRYNGTWATGGFTTRHIRYNHLPGALHSDVAIISLIGGTNDIRQHVPLEDTQENIDYMVSALQGNDQLPVLATIPPYDVGTTAQQAQVLTFNEWITSYATTKSLPLVDYHSLLVDPATGLYRAGYDVDGIHPNSLGAFTMGGALAATLATLGGGVDPTLLTTFSPSALLADATMTGPPAGRTPTWTKVVSNTGGGSMTQLTGSGWVGNMDVVTRGSSDYYLLGTVSPLISGHTVAMSFIMATDPIPTGGHWSILLRDATSKRTICGYSAMDQAISYGISNWQITVPHGLSPRNEYQLLYVAQAAPGTSIGLAQVSIEDLSA
jgi:lysophospholipase L1-like esterase